MWGFINHACMLGGVPRVPLVLAPFALARIPNSKIWLISQKEKEQKKKGSQKKKEIICKGPRIAGWGSIFLHFTPTIANNSLRDPATEKGTEVFRFRLSPQSIRKDTYGLRYSAYLAALF